MKRIFTLFICVCFAHLSHAQWSDTKNQFYDSLHMPVTLATGEQVHSIVVKSYPDSGYFVIWDDARTTGNGYDIYAQKYDKAGKALWAANGIAVIAGVDNQAIAPPSNADYRYISHACTDSAGGFYVAWADDNQTGSHSSVRGRVCAQHMLQDGTPRFAYPGFVVAQPLSTSNYGIYSPQLVADGNKGFFVSYLRNNDVLETDLFVACYRDENGTMVSYGGGQTNVNAVNKISNTPCGDNTKNDVEYQEADINDYYIYPDLQGGCNVVFSYGVNAGGNERQRIGFNRLCRVKKESHVTVKRRTNDIANADIFRYTYKKDSVVMLYQVKTYFSDETCRLLDGSIVAYTNTFVENFGNGFLFISDLAYGLEYPKATLVQTSGNINVNVIATSQRDYVYTNNSLTDWYKRVFYRQQEVYDSIPYQLTTDTLDPYFAYNIFPNKPLDKLNVGEDTLLAAGVYDYDYALASSNNRIFAAGMIKDDNSVMYPRYLNLQQLQVDRMSSDSFAVHFHTTGKGGVTIGKEIATGFGSNNIAYDNPLITTDERGNALFSVTDIGRSVHVSPIADSGRLVWGAMGKAIGSGVFENRYYNTGNPVVAISPADGTALIAWTDDRYMGTNYTGNNIYMRHLDSLNFYNYLPPQRGANLLSYGGSQAFPVYMTGTSLNWSYFEGYYIGPTNGFNTVSTMAGIYDNYNLGNVVAYALDNPPTSPIRTVDGKPYLDRNYAVTPQNNPNGAATIDMRLYFTTAQFVALQKADPTIVTPGDLIVIKQPNTTNGLVPSQYTPASGEERIVPTSWSTVDGGYYIQLQVTSYSNFFIEKNDGILPVNWLNVSAERTMSNTANVTWSVANEVNVKNYLVQYSEDGVTYKDGCTVGANNLGKYSCLVNVSNDKKYYFKVKETDLDGRNNTSKTVWLDRLQQLVKFAILPNPVRSDATLQYNLPSVTTVTLKLVTGTGASVWQQKATLSTSGTIKVPMNSLPAGTYSLQVILPKGTQLLKIVKE